MDTTRWQQVRGVLADALELTPADRPAFLDQACDDDPGMRQEVESFLALDEENPDFIEQPAFPRPPGDPGDGLRIGHYRTVRVLARGGMGSVFLAVREDDYEQRVALKLIRRGLDSRELVRRFHTERQILAHLDHPHIARILDGGTTDDGRPYFVMEYVEGEPIDHYCDTHKLTTRQRLELFRQVCSAVHFAHQNLVVHRDLKPGNILVTADGEPKLLDFGIAKVLDPEPGAQGLTTVPGIQPMTLKYASPEQVQEQPITTASDVYSLGVLLYKLLAGRLPCRLETCSRLQSLWAICEEQPTRPSVVVRRKEEIPGPDDTAVCLTPESVSRTRDGDPRKLWRRLSGDVDSIVLMAMRKEPQRRYPSAEQFGEDIRRHLSGLPVIARRASLAYRSAKFVRRYRLRLMAAAAVLLLTVGLSIERTIQAKKAVQAESQADLMSAVLDEFLTAFNPDEAKGKPVMARDFLDRLRELLATGQKDEPEIRAELLQKLGDAYVKLGHYPEARETLEESLEILRQHFPGDHSELAKAINNLAGLRFRMGAYNDAEELYREAIEMRRRLGHEDIRLVKPMNNWASCLTNLGEFTEAEKIYRRGLEIRRKHHGPGHKNLATSLHSLATVLFMQGDLEQAEPLLHDALAIRRRECGPQSTDVADVLNSLGRIYQARGNLDEAVLHYDPALAIRRERLGENHPDVAPTKKDLASLLLARGDTAIAGVLLTQALEVLRRTKEEGHWRIADAESVLGSYLVALGRYEEAEPCLIESYQRINDQFGERYSIYTDAALGRIVELYEAWGKPEEAAEYRAIAAGLQERTNPH